MSTLIKNSIEILIKNIEKQKKNSFNIYQFSKQVTLDIICKY